MPDVDDVVDPPTRWVEDGKGNEHWDGVPWHSAPLPRRWHFCSPQTRGATSQNVPVERCRCGAIRMALGVWIDKNSRRLR